MNQLSSAQRIAAQYLSLPKAERPTIEEIAAAAGVSRTAIYDWKKNAAFNEEVKRQIINNNVDALPDLVAALPVIALQEKSAAMAKLALQVHGMLTDKVDVVTATTTSHGPSDIESLKARLAAMKQRREADHAEAEAEEADEAGA